MKFTIRIEARHVLIFIISIVIVLGVSSGIAQTPNPGHGWQSIEIPTGTWIGLRAEFADTADRAINADYATTAGSADYATNAGSAVNADEANIATNANARHDIDDTTETYTSSLTRYHITATAPNYALTTKPIDHDILTELCGDFDGCEVRLGMTKWTSVTQTQTANRGPWIFYYVPGDGHWRLRDNSGVDNDGTTQHVVSIWDTCYFTDGEYLDGVSQGDNSVGFGLLVWDGYTGPERTCELTLID